MNRLDQLFAHMDAWRHLPAYQLERRADIFFSLYLVEVLEAFTGVALRPQLIPELPVKRDLIWPETPSRQSVKVDYAAFAADRSRLYLVELKTDSGSRRDQQDLYLERAQALGLPTILGGLIEIVQASAAHQKYAYLLAALEAHRCLTLPDELMALTFQKSKRGLRACQREIQITVEPDEFEIEVIYVQPTKAPGEVGIIDFEDFAQVVEGHEDEISQIFARHLRRWRQPAGSVRPG